MKQQTFSDFEYAHRRKTTKREEFLDSMETIIPWKDWVEMIRPYYPQGKRGRKPIEIETMLRMYLMQNWFNLSDVAMEDAIYDSYAMRKFMRLDFISQQVPDATTLLHFRHLMESHLLGEKIFHDVTRRLESAGLMMHGGTIVDATIIAAPSSTKNQTGERDPEMHQTKKGNQWYFGMKVHTGVCAGSGYVHTVTGTAANVHDINETHKLIRPDDEVAYGDSGYNGVESRKEFTEDPHLSTIEFRSNVRPSKIKTNKNYPGIQWDRAIEQRKSSIRSKVEHPFLIVKRFFGYAKVVYRGISKNLNRFNILFASANLLNCIRAKRTKEFCMG
ncbi:IS5 family transposase [Proteiniclasticum sp. QWL-01]|uniref:IS5 family transposase n=1 Tax=Proteiniclasticum sp. QWL-01 TaxID=3036945 RepID=UPI00240ED646|nr:IS5 family transposase [Proteiniclasticum sp. QWL-01]WFF72284.1 IS5 family transposase [Proteiniclasticum sp. QWL-01]WFF72783.1 IS5 family transposase [Proteiniclasticum sp. QWL-01]WFF73038.1 IS5 family transposase [Proteiniclasticum sp. QWL-01]WFF73665.1 IS5 family transposase [Proteiniclasticum sp. QWL-01]